MFLAAGIVALTILDFLLDNSAHAYKTAPWLREKALIRLHTFVRKLSSEVILWLDLLASRHGNSTLGNAFDLAYLWGD